MKPDASISKAVLMLRDTNGNMQCIIKKILEFRKSIYESDVDALDPHDVLDFTLNLMNCLSDSRHDVEDVIKLLEKNGDAMQGETT